MQIGNFELKPGNYFVAMEYYRLVFNRTFLVLITDEMLIGIKVRGIAGAKTGSDPIVDALVPGVDGDLQDPFTYLSAKYTAGLSTLDVMSDELLKRSRANFRIERKDILKVRYDPTRKWGMGYYPHDGRVYVDKMWGSREFIILGNQSGQAIADVLNRKTRL